MNLLARSFYDVLGVEESASQATIRRAYLDGCRKYHPDKSRENGGDEAFNMFATAYETLHNPTTRASYDNTLRTQQSQPRDKPTPILIQGNERFQRLELARRLFRKGGSEISQNKHLIEKHFQLQLGTLRFDEGVPCNGESCSSHPHTLYRLTDKKLIGDISNLVFVCLKHKYIHLCSADCYTVYDTCLIFAWYLVKRWHRHHNAKKLLKPTSKRVKCTKAECAFDGEHKERGFVRLYKNVYTCKQHPLLHLCDEKEKNLCEFAEDGRNPGDYICWATRRSGYSPHYEISMSHQKAPVNQGVFDLGGRMRVLDDGSTMYVPWGLNIGNPIPEMENSHMAEVGKQLQAAADEAKEQRLQAKEEEETELLPDEKNANIYQRYIGLLGKEKLDQESLGDYVTIHHGRMGGDEGGTGFEGMEDEIEDEELERELVEIELRQFEVKESKTLLLSSTK